MFPHHISAWQDILPRFFCCANIEAAFLQAQIAIFGLLLVTYDSYVSYKSNIYQHSFQHCSQYMAILK